MNVPPLLLGCALLFWGWQTGLLFIAVPAAVALEASRWIRWRLDLEADHYRRLWNLSFLLVVGLALFQFFAQGGYGTVSDLVGSEQPGIRTESLRGVSNLALRLVQTVPAALLLFMLAFAYGPLRELPAAAFSLVYRRRAAQASRPQTKLRMAAINPAYAYLILLLLSAGASREHARWYFPIMAGFIGWMLWHRRPTSFRPWAWATALVLAVGLGFSTQAGLIVLQQWLDRWQNRLLSEYGRPEIDTTQTRTSMGRSGRLKLSGQIIWRIQPGDNNPPELLREAAFNRYEQPAGRRAPDGGEPTWTTLLRKFEPILDSSANRPADVRPPTRTYTWILNPHATANQSLIVTGYTLDGEANIPQPPGTAVVTDLTSEVVAVHTNAIGAARVNGADKLAVLELRHGEHGGFEVGPTDDDRSLERLAPADATAIATVAEQLRLGDSSPEAALAQLRLFFFNHFEYSTDLRPPTPGSTNDTPLASFLLDQRRGHCEYFATATTLLLRAAGIPARYAIGYAVQEKRSGNEFVVRSRHAHAWSLAWLNDRWIEIDTTPAGWFEAEWAKAGTLETYRDWISDAWLGFHRWRQGDSDLRLYIFIAGVLALGFMAWRQVTGKPWRRVRPAAGSATDFERRGLDSEFFHIERALLKSHPRPATEPLRAWLARQTMPSAELGRTLLQLLELHYRLRFDPAGLSPAERQKLREESARWLQTFTRQSGG